VKVTLSRKVTSLALVAPLLLAFCHFGRTSAGAALRGSSRAKVVFASHLPLASDLDGDSRLDRVSLQSHGFDKTISIRFGNARASEFKFAVATPEPGTLLGNDIDGDGDVDLVWVADRDQNTAVVLINDGTGDFTEAKNNAPYAAQLNALLSADDPQNPQSFQSAHQISSLTSSSFTEIDVAETSRLAGPTTRAIFRSAVSGFAECSSFLSDIRKRGPPPPVS
jgi:hypothetical protein